MRSSIERRLTTLESKYSPIRSPQKRQWFGVDVPVILRAMDDDTLDRLEMAIIARNAGSYNEGHEHIIVQCICDGYRAYCEEVGIDPVECEAAIEVVL